jgi:hypothetical protein
MDVFGAGDEVAGCSLEESEQEFLKSGEEGGGRGCSPILLLWWLWGGGSSRTHPHNGTAAA